MNLSNITVNAQSSIKITGSKVLYFDPFEISDEMHDADIIFVTHEHFDHFDVASISKIKGDASYVVAPESMKKKVLAEAGIDESRCIFYQPGNEYELLGLKIKTVPAYNKMKPFHMKSSKWQGYIVDMDELSYYVAGDTDANDDVKQVKCDVALIPIGGHYTMDKKQAAELILGMKPSAVIPTHYGKIVGKIDDGDEFKKMIENSNSEILVELKLDFF